MITTKYVVTATVTLRTPRRQDDAAAREFSGTPIVRQVDLPQNIHEGERSPVSGYADSGTGAGSGVKQTSMPRPPSPSAVACNCAPCAAAMALTTCLQAQLPVNRAHGRKVSGQGPNERREFTTRFINAGCSLLDGSRPSDWLSDSPLSRAAPGDHNDSFERCRDRRVTWLRTSRPGMGWGGQTAAVARSTSEMIALVRSEQPDRPGHGRLES